MIERKHGRIVNISSASGQIGLGGIGPLRSLRWTKGGVIALSRALAWELGRYGITVNCASPGWIVPNSADHTGDEQLLEAMGL